MTDNWMPAETTTHQDHVIAHVMGATVLGYFVIDEVLYILLDIGIKCRERREIRRRLRHCIGIQTPTSHCPSRRCGKDGKAGARFEVRSQDIGLMTLVGG